MLLCCFQYTAEIRVIRCLNKSIPLKKMLAYKKNGLICLFGIILNSPFMITYDVDKPNQPGIINLYKV